jgi:hypothetical protein
MRPGPMRILPGGSHREGVLAIPGAGRRERVRMFILAAAAGLAVVAGAMAGATAAHAAASVPAAHAAAVAQSHLMVDPCPCDNPVCRPLCFQSMTSGAPAATIHRRTHLTAAQSHLMVEPCPCDNPICRPVCFQSMASSGPAAMMHPETHLAAAQAPARTAAVAVNCPPPSAPVASQDGQPSC